MAYRKGKRVERGISRLEDSKLYLVDIMVADPETGQRFRLRQTTHRLDLAREWRDKQKGDALRGEIKGKKQRKKIWFSTFADEYFDAWKLDCKASTADREKRRIDAELKPHFDKQPIHTITRKEIEDYIAKRRDGGISSATANRVLCRIKNMLKKAVDWGYIENNPAAGIKQAREQVKEADFLSQIEVAHLVDASGDRLRPLVVTAVYTGMRFGELMALEWRDIDFERSLLTIRDSKNWEPRHVPMNPAVGYALKAHQRRQTKSEGGIVQLVFPNPRTGTPFKDIRKGFNKALKDAGIVRHFKFHGLRHTAASHLTMGGVDLRTVGKILGHKTAQITLRYAHLAPEFLKGAVDRLDFSLSEKGSEQENKAQ